MPRRRTKDQRKVRTRGAARTAFPGDRRVKDRRASNREFTYVLQIRDEDLRLVHEHQAVLTRGVANFADSYYNYLFDNPSTAEVLYNRERQGGNVSEFVRTQLQQFAAIAIGAVDDANARTLHDIGKLNHQWKVGPVWILGAARLYLEHLRHLLDEEVSSDAGHRERLDAALLKLTYRALGLILQGYWETAVEQAHEERGGASPEYQQVIEILRNLPVAVWSIDVRDLTVLFASPATRGICPEQPGSPVPCLDKVHADDREKVKRAWEQALGGSPSQVECRADLGVGGERGVRFVFNPSLTKAGKVTRVDGLLEDRTEDQASVARLEQMATTDVLTGLANRVLWNDRLERAMASVRRHGTHQVVVMLLDLNQFKMINDTFGHAAGDEVLRQVAERLQSSLRDSDTVARLGGDEFAVLLPAVESAQHAAERVARKLQAGFEGPVRFQGEDLYVSTAIGLATAPDHGEDAETLMQRADIAMYRAKQASLPFLFFHPESDVSISSRLLFTRQLQSALSADEFELHYQPKVDLGSGQPCGVEALLRWQHPDEGLVFPVRFLTLAERTGLIAPITEWVLATALGFCKQWNEDGTALPVSVNVSARSFQDLSLPEKIGNALQAAGVSGELLEVEVTEDTLMADINHGLKMLDLLGELGIAVAVDDFGTGYSSLSFLKRLPVQAFKIDRSFLTDIAANDSDRAIVRAIIQLGHNLGCKVVAEGVEDSATWEVLNELGCDQVQGFHISRPLSEHHFSHWLTDSRRTLLDA